ncbi:efflux RND transporter periplasmic adaptor subunit [Marinobacter sp.]|uniref:efflux RND transporter periplasmic adaptor subunit n=1 Tax=Marinobacter sp. TaxID=50741 RepID=UPI001B68912A|nr:efflux RND transporter periplasmic adaptor subunit [Marinobacter sp.]MBQ0833219.1 efflux RND transporter periplasmic adaptor subunit [Marinobacter sp.]
MNISIKSLLIIALPLFSVLVHGAELELSPEQLETAGLATITVTSRENASRVKLTGSLTADQRKSHRIASVVEGIVTELQVVTHDRVREGQVLAKLRSNTLGQAQADYLEALFRFQLTQTEKTRIAGLRREGIVAESRLLKVNSDYKTARANLKQRRRLLSLTGLSDQQIQALEDKPDLLAEFELTSPIDGIVSVSTIESGQLLPAGEAAFHVDDLSSLWLEVQIPVASLPLVKVGAEALIQVQSTPDRPFHGKLQSLGTEVNRQSQTLEGRIVVANSEGLLYPGMYAEVSISGVVNQSLTVPASAVFRVGDQAYVFQALGGGRFEPTQVGIGSGADGLIPIQSGLETGATVVTQGVAELKSHWQYQGGE